SSKSRSWVIYKSGPPSGGPHVRYRRNHHVRMNGARQNRTHVLDARTKARLRGLGGGHGGGGFEPQLLDRQLTHLELLDLASDSHREGIHELDVSRHLEMSDLPAAVVAHVLVGDGTARPRDHPGHQLLAVALIGNPDH